MQSFCSFDIGGGFRARREGGGGVITSSEESGIEVNVLLASADIWVALVEQILKQLFLRHESESPPARSDEVPDGVSTRHDGASDSVQTLQHVFGQLRAHHLETNVDSTGGDINGIVDELLETSISVWDGFALALWVKFSIETLFSVHFVVTLTSCHFIIYLIK